MVKQYQDNGSPAELGHVIVSTELNEVSDIRLPSLNDLYTKGRYQVSCSHKIQDPRSDHNYERTESPL